MATINETKGFSPLRKDEAGIAAQFVGSGVDFITGATLSYTMW